MAVPLWLTITAPPPPTFFVSADSSFVLEVRILRVVTGAFCGSADSKGVSMGARRKAGMLRGLKVAEGRQGRTDISRGNGDERAGVARAKHGE
jgi:hypothetical protein